MQQLGVKRVPRWVIDAYIKFIRRGIGADRPKKPAKARAKGAPARRSTPRLRKRPGRA